MTCVRTTKSGVSTVTVTQDGIPCSKAFGRKKIPVPIKASLKPKVDLMKQNGAPVNNAVKGP